MDADFQQRDGPEQHDHRQRGQERGEERVVKRIVNLRPGHGEMRRENGGRDALSSRLMPQRRCPSHRNSTGTRKPNPNESHTSQRWRIERNARMTPSTIVAMSATAIITTNARNSHGE